MPRVAFPTTYLGFDPGKDGGLAAVQGDDALAVKMPETERDVWDWLDAPSFCERFAVLEKVGGYQGNGHPGSAMFKFGAGYGALKMALTAAGIPFEEVTPQRWQKAFGMKRKKGEGDTAWKNRLKAKAQQLFPSVKVTLATADALLLAEYCRRKRTGTL